MRDARLQSRLRELGQTLRGARLAKRLAVAWGIAAGVSLVLLALHVSSWVFPAALWAVGGVAALLVTRGGHASGEALRTIEAESPKARDLLRAAAEQEARGSRLSFLQWRVVEEALAHPEWGQWKRRARTERARAVAGQIAAMGVLVAVALAARQSEANGTSPRGRWLAGGEEISVTPGDTNVERGTSLVIAARFGGTPPAEAAVVFRTAAGKESRMGMARRLADPVFGANVPEVSEAATYHIEYGGKKTREYNVGVFDYPALTRADATLRYPAYTGLTNRTIPDTRRVSAVEGSHLNYVLQLNKAVARAQWVGKSGSIPFAVATNGTAELPDFVLASNATYRLELVDAEGRKNKFPIDFVLQALTNQRPVVRMTFPRGDARVSKLEELRLQAEASDDFGIVKYGIGYGVAGQEPKFVELGQTAPPNAKRQFEYLVSLEKLGVEVDQSMSYFAWADDLGPDGKERRTFSDIYFADVRPFDEVFRADASGMDAGQNGGAQGQGDERVKLAEMQKQIVIATWNLEKLGEESPHHP